MRVILSLYYLYNEENGDCVVNSQEELLLLRDSPYIQIGELVLVDDNKRPVRIEHYATSLKRALLGHYRADYPELADVTEETVDWQTIEFLLELFMMEPADFHSSFAAKVMDDITKMESFSRIKEVLDFDISATGVVETLLEVMASFTRHTVSSFEMINFPEVDSLGLDIFAKPFRYSVQYGLELAMQGEKWHFEDPRTFVRAIESDKYGKLRFEYLRWLTNKMFILASSHHSVAYQAASDVMQDFAKGQATYKPLQPDSQALSTLTRKQKASLLVQHYSPEHLFFQMLPQFTNMMNRWSKALLPLFDYLRVAPQQSKSMRETDQTVLNRSEIARHKLQQHFFDLFTRDNLSAQEVDSVCLMLFDNFHLGYFLSQFPNRSVQFFASGFYAEVKAGLFFLDNGMTIHEPEDIALAERMGEDLRVDNYSVQVKGDFKLKSELLLFNLSIPDHRSKALAWIAQKDADGSKGYKKSLEILEEYARKQNTTPMWVIAPTRFFDK